MGIIPEHVQSRIMWLRYVIFDDMDMDWEAHELDSHWINTENVLVGLSEADAMNAISIINQ